MQPGADRAPETARPNIVFILADDTGYGDLGCYNAECATPTPNLDRLAAEGIRFTDAHSSSALCTPTRYGLLTGRYLWRTPKGHSLVMPYEPPVIESDRLTLPGLLRNHGYRTACIGKWHLGLHYPSRRGGAGAFTQREEDIDFAVPLRDGPVERGFDSFFGTAGCSTSDPPYCFIRGDRTVGIPSVPTSEELHALPGFFPGLMVPGWRPEDVDVTFVNEARRLLDAPGSGGKAAPFFLYLALSAPHNPWVPPDFVRGRSAEGPRGDMNALVDWCVGQVLEALEARGFVDDTLVVFTSDNGPMRGQSGHRSAAGLRGFKNTPFEGGHRVPFVARWPSRIPRGTVSTELLCLTDMMATFAALVGAPLPADAADDSHDVLAALVGSGAGNLGRPAMVVDTGGAGAAAGDFAIRRGKWKLILMAPRDTDAPGGPPRYLFDLENDPTEQDNLVERCPSVVRDLEHVFDLIRARGSRFVRIPEDDAGR
jgi:arylsulfatase A-like enzyme